MQTCPFRQKVNKQHAIVLKQLSRFRNSWEGKTIEPSKIESYCQLVDFLSQLHSNYVFSCMEYLTPIMKQEMIHVNKTIVEDLIKKIKYFAEIYKKTYKNSQPKEKKQICQLCSSKIRQVDVKIIKQHLSDDQSIRRNLLKKIYADMENQNAELFSKDEDEVFFKFLNRMLVKKQELLAMQTNQLNDFLLQVTKSFSDLNFLTEFTPGNTGISAFKHNYQQELQKTITDSLKSGFGNKIHPWIQKVFQTMKKQIQAQKKAFNIEKSIQTENDLNLNKKRSQYITAGEHKREVQDLKQQIKTNMLKISDLQSQLTVLQKQKKQLQEYYTKEVQQLMKEKKQVELKLRKIQADFKQLKQTNEEISQINKKLRNQRKKTENSLYNRSNRSIKDQQKQDRRDAKDEIIEGKSQKNDHQQPKKKKSPINKLLSKKIIPSQKALFVDDTIKQDPNSQYQISQKNSNDSVKKQERKFLKEESLTEIKFDKKSSLKNLENSLTKRQKGSQNQQQKVEFNLREQRCSVDKKRPSINNYKSSSLDVASESNRLISGVGNQVQAGQVKPMKKKSSFLRQKMENSSRLIKSRQSNQKKSNQSMRSKLSIDMGMGSGNFQQKQQKQQQSNGQYISKLKTTLEQNEQSIHTQGIFNNDSCEGNRRKNENVNSKSQMFKGVGSQSNNMMTNKKVFEFKPIQSKEEYEEMKGKVGEIMAIIESKASQKVKSFSIKHIQQQQQLTQKHNKANALARNSNFDPSKLNASSIFACNQNNISCGRGIIGDLQTDLMSKQQKPRYIADQMQENYNDNENNHQYRQGQQINHRDHSHLKHKNQLQQNDQYQIAQGSLDNKHQKSNKKKVTYGYRNHCMDTSDRMNESQSLFQKLKEEKVIPQELTIQHFELIIRGLFRNMSAKNIIKNSHNVKFNPFDRAKSNKSLSNDTKHVLVSVLHSRRESINKNHHNIQSLLSYSISGPNLASQMNSKQTHKINLNPNLLTEHQNISLKNCKSEKEKQKVILNLPKLQKISQQKGRNQNNKNSKSSKQKKTELRTQTGLENQPNNNTISYNQTYKKDDQTYRKEIIKSLENQDKYHQVTKNKAHQNVNKIREKPDPLGHKNQMNNHLTQQNDQNKYQLNSLMSSPTKIPHMDTHENVVDKNNKGMAIHTPMINHNLVSLNLNSPHIKRRNQTTNNSPQKYHSQVFTFQDLGLFFDSQLAAYQYEQISDHKVKFEDKLVSNLLKKLKQDEKNCIQSLFSILSHIRQKNKRVYYKIQSFLKYPYQSVKHGFEFINTNKELTIQKLTQYLIKLYGLRVQHEQSRKISFAQFIQPFELKVVSLFIKTSK